MKTIIIVCLLLLPAFSHAQLLEEWINQKATQRKYLAVQIAALQTYLGYLKKGYTVVNGGLTTIGKIKSGDFDLHNTFFSSLKTVSPRVKNSAKVVELISAQIALVAYCKRSYKTIRSIGAFDADKLIGINDVFQGFLNEIGEDADVLTEILSDGRLEMSDSDRMEKIDFLYKHMLYQRAIIAQFSAEMVLYAQGRKHQAIELQNYKKLVP